MGHGRDLLSPSFTIKLKPVANWTNGTRKVKMTKNVTKKRRIFCFIITHRYGSMAEMRFKTKENHWNRHRRRTKKDERNFLFFLCSIDERKINKSLSMKGKSKVKISSFLIDVCLQPRKFSEQKRGETLFSFERKQRKSKLNVFFESFFSLVDRRENFSRKKNDVENNDWQDWHQCRW